MNATAGSDHAVHLPASKLVDVRIADLTARLVVGGEHTAGGAALVEHEIAPRSLAAPVHTHANEDEYTYVLSGVLGLEVGGRSFEAMAGDVVLKPRAVPHAVWNPGDEPARMLELIVPGGFEQYFVELSRLMPPHTDAPDIGGLLAVAHRYGLDMDLSSIDRLVQQHDLRPAGPPPDQAE